MSYENTLEKVIIRLDVEEKEKDAKIAELMARIAKAELAFAVVEGRIAELEKALRNLLGVTRQIYSDNKELGHAEDAAVEALKEQGE